MISSITTAIETEDFQLLNQYLQRKSTFAELKYHLPWEEYMAIVQALKLVKLKENQPYDLKQNVLYVFFGRGIVIPKRLLGEIPTTKYKKLTAAFMMRSNSIVGKNQNGSHFERNTKEGIKRSFLKKITMFKQNSVHVQKSGGMNENTVYTGSRDITDFEVFQEQTFYYGGATSVSLMAIDGNAIVLKLQTDRIQDSTLNFLREKYMEKVRFLMEFPVFKDVQRPKLQVQIRNFRFIQYKFDEQIYSNKGHYERLLEQGKASSNSKINSSATPPTQSQQQYSDATVYFLHIGEVEITVRNLQTHKKSSYIIKGPNLLQDSLPNNLKQDQTGQILAETARCVTQKCICYVIDKFTLQEIIVRSQAQNSKNKNLANNQKNQFDMVVNLGHNLANRRQSNISNGNGEKDGNKDHNHNSENKLSILEELHNITNIRMHYYTKTEVSLQRNLAEGEEKQENDERKSQAASSEINAKPLSRNNHNSQQNLSSKKVFRIKDHFSNSLNEKYNIFAEKKINFLLNRSTNANSQFSPSLNSTKSKMLSTHNQSTFNQTTTSNFTHTKYTEQQDQNFENKTPLQLLAQSQTAPILYQIKQMHPSAPEMRTINAKLKLARLQRISRVKDQLIKTREQTIVNTYSQFLKQQGKETALIDEQIKDYVSRYLCKKFWRKKGGNVLVSYMHECQLTPKYRSPIGSVKGKRNLGEGFQGKG